MTWKHKEGAFRSGDREEQGRVQHELREMLGTCKHNYRRKLEAKFQQNSVRDVWTGMKHITGVKGKDRQTSGSLDRANHFNQLFNRFTSLTLYWLSVQLWVMSPAEIFWRLSCCQVYKRWKGGWVQDTGRQLCRVVRTDSPEAECQQDRMVMVVFHWTFSKKCVSGLCRVMSEGQPHLNYSESARVLCRCKSSGGIKTQSDIRHRAIYWLDEGLKVTFHIVGLKSKFIFTPTYQPDCSSDLWRWPPLLCVQTGQQFGCIFNLHATKM